MFIYLWNVIAIYGSIMVYLLPNRGIEKNLPNLSVFYGYFYRLTVSIAAYATLCRISLRGIWRWRRRALGSCGWRIWGRFHLSVTADAVPPPLKGRHGSVQNKKAPLEGSCRRSRLRDVRGPLPMEHRPPADKPRSYSLPHD